MNEVLDQFEESALYLHDTSRLNEDVNKDEWVEKMKCSKWYGPFSHKSFVDTYMFCSSDDSGDFTGI